MSPRNTNYGLTYTIGMDCHRRDLPHVSSVFGLPTHYFIDGDGIIRDRVFGPVDQASVETKLAEILGP